MKKKHRCVHHLLPMLLCHVICNANANLGPPSRTGAVETRTLVLRIVISILGQAIVNSSLSMFVDRFAPIKVCGLVVDTSTFDNFGCWISGWCTNVVLCIIPRKVDEVDSISFLNLTPIFGI